MDKCILCGSENIEYTHNEYWWNCHDCHEGFEDSQLKHAYGLGWQAFIDGQNRNNCPYRINSDDFKAWRAGWDASFNSVLRIVPKPEIPRFETYTYQVDGNNYFVNLYFSMHNGVIYTCYPDTPKEIAKRILARLQCDYDLPVEIMYIKDESNE